MDPNSLFAALPDLSARIMRHMVTSELNVNWDMFCRNSHLNPVRLDYGATELLAQDEMLLQQGFLSVTANDPYLWFDAGLRYRSVNYGALGLAMMTACTLADALKIACLYHALTFSLIRYRYAEGPNGACALIGDTTGVTPHLHDFTQHRDLGAIRTLVSDLMSGEPVLERVTVAAGPPCNWQLNKRHFTCPVEFNADCTQWIFKPGAASLALPLADQSLQVLYSASCAKHLGQANSDAPVVQRLSALLNARRKIVSASEAAKQLALSERTLHRRLAEEGTRFSTIVDDARYRHARDLLCDKRMTVEAIAFAVGFAEPSSFSRAFKRWSGVGALEYRRQMIQVQRPRSPAAEPDPA